MDEIARPAARETAAVAAAGEAQEEGASGALEVTPEVISDSERGEGSKGGGGVEEATAAAAAEEASRVQEMLENRLREAKASATGFKEALQEMEGVVAGLREEEVSADVAERGGGDAYACVWCVVSLGTAACCAVREHVSDALAMRTGHENMVSETP